MIKMIDASQRQRKKMSTKKLGFIGLDTMGNAMASRMLEAGHSLIERWVWRSTARPSRLQRYGPFSICWVATGRGGWSSNSQLGFYYLLHDLIASDGLNSGMSALGHKRTLYI